MLRGRSLQTIPCHQLVTSKMDKQTPPRELHQVTSARDSYAVAPVFYFAGTVTDPDPGAELGCAVTSMSIKHIRKQR